MSICLTTKMKGYEMNLKQASKRFVPLVAVGFMMCALPGHAQGVLSTISGVAVSGGYDYTILLQNTGSVDLNGFWYGWTFNGNNLPSNPSDANNSLGWDNELAGNSIIWQNSSGSALASGQTGTFTFFSTDTPTEITTSPSGESFAYVGAVDGSDSTPVFSPTLVPAPEPSSVALLAVGSACLLMFGQRKFKR
jgi:hypothetical protein